MPSLNQMKEENQAQRSHEVGKRLRCWRTIVSKVNRSQVARVQQTAQSLANKTSDSKNPNKVSPVTKPCPTYDTWHPMQVLHKYNIIVRKKGGNVHPLEKLDGVSFLPKEKHRLHCLRIDCLRANWGLKDGKKHYPAGQRELTPPKKDTVKKEVITQFKAVEKIEHQVKKGSSQDQKDISRAEQMREALTTQTMKGHEKGTHKSDSMTEKANGMAKVDLGKIKETALKCDGKVNTKEQETEEEWVVVDDTEAMEDPFVYI
ncbi:MAG: hypothetical protein Q9219_000644 [cf. Caloplaca sp. 3 TL-2023]